MPCTTKGTKNAKKLTFEQGCEQVTFQGRVFAALADQVCFVSFVV